MLGVGEKVAERYTVLYPLGTGGQATVYAAHHDLLGRAFALKVLGPRGSEDRLLREARLRNRLDSRWVVPVHDALGTDRGLILVMDLVEGCSLDAILRAGPLSEAEGLALFGAVARCLQQVHGSGVLHRDLKPSNVLLDVHDGWVRVRLTDFGSARGEDSDSLTLTGDAVGTLRYAAPEQLMDASVADARSDLYALGVLLHDLLGGDRSAAPRPSGVPDRWREVVQGLTHAAPAARPSSVDEVLARIGDMDPAPLAAGSRIARIVRTAAEETSAPTEGPDYPSFAASWSTRGLLAGAVGSAVVTVLRIGYDSLPTSPDDLTAPVLLVPMSPPADLALPSAEACAAIVEAARARLLRTITLQEVLMWTAFAWSGVGMFLGAGLEAIAARLRRGRTLAAFVFGFVCFFLAHQLPARNARVWPDGVLGIDLRSGVPECNRWVGGPLGEPDLEGLAAALIGGMAAVRVVWPRRRWDVREELLGMLRAGLVVCAAVAAIYQLGLSAGVVPLPGIPRWIFDLDFPHPDRVLLLVGMGIGYVAALRAPPPRRGRSSRPGSGA